MSITFTTPNDQWLATKVANNEYSSKSEIVNDLVRKARKEQEELELIQSKLMHAEQSGFTTQTKAHMLQEFKRELGLNG